MLTSQDQGQLEPAPAALQQGQLQQLAGAQPGAQRAAQVEARTARRRRVAARQRARKLASDQQQQLGDLLHFLGVELRKVGVRRHLLRAVGGGGQLTAGVRRQVGRELRRLAGTLRQARRRQHPLAGAGIVVGERRLVLPVTGVAGVEQLLLRASLGRGAAQRNAESLRVGQRQRRRAQRIRLLARSQAHALAAQQPAEANDARRQAVALRAVRGHRGSLGHVAPAAHPAANAASICRVCRRTWVTSS